jgi:hypothetical protein
VHGAPPRLAEHGLNTGRIGLSSRTRQNRHARRTGGPIWRPRWPQFTARHPHSDRKPSPRLDSAGRRSVRRPAPGRQRKRSTRTRSEGRLSRLALSASVTVPERTRLGRLAPMIRRARVANHRTVSRPATALMKNVRESRLQRHGKGFPTPRSSQAGPGTDSHTTLVSEPIYYGIPRAQAAPSVPNSNVRRAKES